MSALNRRLRRALVASRNSPEAQRFAQFLGRESARLDDYSYMYGLEAENQAINKWKRKVEPRLVNMPELHEANQVNAELRTRIQILETARIDVDELPQDLPATLRLAERLYPDRLTFTDAARKAAAVAACQNVHVAWRMLRSVATVLHDLYGTSKNIQKDFEDRTGFQLALSESSATRADPALIRQRLVRYGSRLLFAEGHVKYGTKPPQLLRIHYVFPVGSAQVIVSHVGDHLETAGTRRGRGR